MLPILATNKTINHVELNVQGLSALHFLCMTELKKHMKKADLVCKGFNSQEECE